ncbi:hypothetical protein [Thalassomonas sp. M1454]|uniref:hypothetical protein n=1 Tax=Thalassomonas sp. M1454 TaxID=2594477 RepID=UPI001180EF62|nr:hypothetical protein [Thalassomonas sp. M1454]TRX57982.1 hypothetical protein FNN08_00925 [Thalassomonas sp. M1454]
MVKRLQNVWMVIAALVLSISVHANEQEGVISLSVPDKIGFAERPIITVDVDIAQTRDLYVALQNGKTFKSIKSQFKRISKSGTYKFQLDVGTLKPGSYRWNAYLTPKGKNWNFRLADSTMAMMDVVNRELYKTPVVLGTSDKISKVNWPDQINDDNSYDLSIDFDVTEPRILHVKLLESETWKEFGAIEFPVKEPGNMTLPFEQIVTNFPAGRYAWVIYLVDEKGQQLEKRKFGKHFNIANAK